MLRLNNIQVIYSNVILVLKGLSLEVPEGQIVALLGRQRRGQDDHAQGDLRPAQDRGRQGHRRQHRVRGPRIDGRSIPRSICRLGIVQVMEGRKVLESLTVEENLKIGAHTRRDPDGVRRTCR